MLLGVRSTAGLFKIFKIMRTPENKKTKQPLATRSLKIQPDIKFNRWSQTTVPVIRLTGVWLNRLGFNPYQRVTITTKNKLLIIRLDE
jgi:uncharacterized membrane protein